MATQLKNPGPITFTAQKEYAVWIGGAKQAETKLRRAEQAVVKILESKKSE